MKTRNRYGLTFGLVIAISTFAAGKVISDRAPHHEITVYRQSGCHCCKLWVQHLEEHGFQISDMVREEVQSIKKDRNVPRDAYSCHTAVVGDYVIEGHVPASIILQLLEEKPAIAGLAVPGMPVGSPGMDGEGVQAEPYDVWAFDSDGNTWIYATIGTVTSQ